MSRSISEKMVAPWNFASEANSILGNKIQIRDDVAEIRLLEGGDDVGKMVNEKYNYLPSPNQGLNISLSANKHLKGCVYRLNSRYMTAPADIFPEIGGQAPYTINTALLSTTAGVYFALGTLADGFYRPVGSTIAVQSNRALECTGAEGAVSPNKEFSVPVWCRTFVEADIGWVIFSGDTVTGDDTGVYANGDGTYQIFMGGVDCGGVAIDFGNGTYNLIELENTYFENELKHKVSFRYNGVTLLDLFDHGSSANIAGPLVFSGTVASGVTVATGGADQYILTIISIYDRSRYYDKSKRVHFLNPHLDTTIAVIGDSNGRGSELGGNQRIDSWWAELQKKISGDGIDNVIVYNYAFGGTTMYEGAPTGMSYPYWLTASELSDRDVADPTLNITKVLEDLEPDLVISFYTKNHLADKPGTPWVSGANVASELTWVLNKIQSECNNYGSAFMTVDNTPLENGTGTGIALQTSETAVILRDMFGNLLPIYDVLKDPSAPYAVRAEFTAGGSHVNKQAQLKESELFYKILGPEIQKIGNNETAKGLGGSTARPLLPKVSQIFFDIGLVKSILYNGSAWVNVDGSGL